MNPNESTSAPVEEEDTAHKGFWQHQILKLMEKHNEEGFDMKVLLNDIDEVLKFHRQLFEVSTQEENARLRSLIEKAFYENNGYQYTWEQFKKDNNLPDKPQQ
jgi:hypothetical protein